MRALFLVILMAWAAAVWFLAGAAPPVPANANALNLKHRNSFVVYPSDLNHMNTLFGGRTMAEMDRVAGITVRRLLFASEKARAAVTVSVTDVKFAAPGRQGDLIHVEGAVAALGRKSITVDVLVLRETAAKLESIASGRYVFVAYDPEKQTAVEHGLSLK